MKTKLSKRATRIYKKAVEKTVIRKEFLKICRQRDWIALIAIAEFISIGVLAWMIK